MPRTVRVLLFARAREIAGRESVDVVLEERARLSDVVGSLTAALPDLAAYLKCCRFAVNREFEDLDHEVPEGAEVAVIPPVSGGCAPPQ